MSFYLGSKSGPTAMGFPGVFFVCLFFLENGDGTVSRTQHLGLVFSDLWNDKLQCLLLHQSDV